VLPVVRAPGPAGGGWGLNLVERLAAGWGAAHRGGGKIVWCELSATFGPTTPASEETAA
jgi:hypothetical protein